MILRRFAPLFIGMALLASWPAHADPADALYTARALVTGTRPETRPPGFAACIEDVLIKVSGDPRLHGDPRLAPIKANAGALITNIAYHDQLEGIPKHDEQGSRDRPFDLICTFSHAGIDRVLHSLGERPWTAPRPKLAVFLGVSTATGDYVLASDGEHGVDQRLSLAAGADKRGMTAVLPSTALIAAQHLTFHGLAAAGPVRPEAAAAAVGGDLALSGTLVWSEKALGWVAHWRLAWHRRLYRWRIRGVSFDEAFRDGIGGAAQILSGHVAPR